LQAFANLVQMGHPCPRKPANAKACNTPTHPGSPGDRPSARASVSLPLKQLCTSARGGPGGPIRSSNRTAGDSWNDRSIKERRRVGTVSPGQ
jgi:hypothetical protein